ncbi:ABC transporter ATP-binding protein [Blastopirellula marina]|uniref:ABC transporter ATP-binding protein n=1 Tax=Blastopirellula marina TaxID=124 RepID=A0A2S8FHR4_9BACT|nr:ABC transporter ATP-binding protein [Blastopirellula marina]PQO31709.1 ABC transporter ATP-binding protein [Blastopirellula marina]PTL43016.1 ABC transporter ATP-binding protein [Blastopirellula marina]
MLSTHDLTKKYGKFLALDHANIEVAEGECCGVLGPNGAGKSTLFRLLMGFLQPSHGQATIGGKDCQHDKVAVHSLVSYLPGDVRLFDEMKGKDVLEFFADIHPRGSRERSYATAKRLDLDITRRVGYMSTGMRQKLGLSIALSTDAPMLIMDEPTTSLDPNVRAEVIRMIGEAHQSGRTVVICSHVLSEIEDICNRAIIMRQGNVVHDQNLHDLARRHAVSFQMDQPLPVIPEALRSRITGMRQTETSVHLETEGDLREVMLWLAQLPLTQLKAQRLGLREVYDRYHAPESEQAA